MPTTKSTKNHGLPANWQRRPAGYFYQVPPGFERTWDGKRCFFLGSSLTQAYRAWVTRVKCDVLVTTVGGLLDRYSVEVVPTKAISTQEGNVFGILRLKSILGDCSLSQVTPQMIHEYFDQREHKIAAHREIEILSHAYTKAVEWGYIKRHPFKGELTLPAEAVRKKRYLEDWEMAEILGLQPRRKAGSVRAIQAYVRLMILTGFRRVDLLTMRVSSIKEDGIEVVVGAARKMVKCLWTDDLRATVELALKSRPNESSPWVFCKADGTGYFNEQLGRADGWDSMWGRFVDRILSETTLVTRFSEHDVRAKFAHDASATEHSQAVMSLPEVRASQRYGEHRLKSLKAAGVL